MFFFPGTGEQIFLLFFVNGFLLLVYSFFCHCIQVNQSLLDMHKVAGEKGDAHLCDFLESKFLDEQVESIKQVSRLCLTVKQCCGSIYIEFWPNLDPDPECYQF